MRERPNIVMIVTDQERYDVVGANGSAVCRTPHLDELASSGTRFTQAFTPAALCSPSRASMLTGLLPHSHGILNNTHGPDALRRDLDREITTFPELLAKDGYRCGFVGKWHAGWEEGPTERGFHDSFAQRYDVDQAEQDRSLLNPITARFQHDEMTIAGIDTRPIEETEAFRETSRAIELLQSYATTDSPFLLRIDYEGPHHPYMPPEPYASMYDPVSIAPWPNFEDELTTKPHAQFRLREQRGVDGFEQWKDWQQIVALYFGFVTFIDSQIGRLCEAIDDLGLTNETVIIHTSDHGDMTGSHGGQFNKGPLMYDELYRVPLIIKDPQARRSVVNELVMTLDLMPTVLELAGLPVPDGIHARSLLPIIRNESPTGDDARDSVFAEFHGDEWGLISQRMVRTREAKYVYTPHGEDELYDLNEDPFEMRNLAGLPEAETLETKMRQLTIRWMQETNDPLFGWARRILP